MRLARDGGRSPDTTRPLRSTPGMRRVDWVRITVGEGATVAEAVGIGHRRPTVRPLPLPLAARLTAEGVPFVVHHQHRPATDPTDLPAGGA